MVKMIDIDIRKEGVGSHVATWCAIMWSGIAGNFRLKGLVRLGKFRWKVFLGENSEGSCLQMWGQNGGVSREISTGILFVRTKRAEWLVLKQWGGRVEVRVLIGNFDDVVCVAVLICACWEVGCALPVVIDIELALELAGGNVEQCEMVSAVAIERSLTTPTIPCAGDVDELTWELPVENGRDKGIRITVVIGWDALRGIRFAVASSRWG